VFHLFELRLGLHLEPSLVGELGLQQLHARDVLHLHATGLRGRDHGEPSALFGVPPGIVLMLLRVMLLRVMLLLLLLLLLVCTNSPCTSPGAPTQTQRTLGIRGHRCVSPRPRSHAPRE
jgi:hypothetical protein